MTALTVVLPLPPSLPNTRGNWRVRDRKRKKYLERCDYCAHVAGLPHRLRPGTPPDKRARPALSFALYLHSYRDADNALASCKHACDWLVQAGYLVDDGPKYCTMAIPTQTIERNKDKQRLEITIKYANADLEDGMIVTSLSDYGEREK